jgi:hypothetical protein
MNNSISKCEALSNIGKSVYRDSHLFNACVFNQTFITSG